MTDTGVDADRRKEIMAEWIGPLSSERKIPEEESWAPSWWHGDEEATMTSHAAIMTLNAARNRR